MSVADPQARAADPAHSVWVSANAGSGKTHVLALRVVRLLLDGVPPAKILCLTFTKAAAANMADRVFQMLAAWTALDDAGLTTAVRATGAPMPGADSLAVARKLFARAVETPGGLKIQTIHAFCERLLHLFPFEANVTSRFTVIQDARRAEMLGQATDAVLAAAVRGRDPALVEAVGVLAGETAETGFRKVIDTALAKRASLRAMLDAHGSPAALRDALEAAFGLGPSDTREALEAAVTAGLPPSEWRAVADRLEQIQPAAVVKTCARPRRRPAVPAGTPGSTCS